MSNFTPGPWSAHIQRSKAGDDLGWIIEHSNGRIGWASLAYADTNQEAAKNDPAREANARLIAAAPDMLAALIDLDARLRECGALHTAEDAYDSFYRGIVEEAIRRATGEGK
jgi:hypothetical protein